MGFLLKPFAMLATGNLRGLFSFLLVVALFGALWETSLVNLSARPTATAVMTEVGIEVVNPALQRSSFGLSEAGWTLLQAQAIANPTKPVTIPGLKVQVLGSQIAHKNFADGSRVIYNAVAQAYYDGGAGAVFSVVPSTILPPSLLPNLLPSLGGSTSTSKPSTGPQLPTITLPSLSAVGLSPAILTTDGHAQALKLDEWLIAAAMLLALLVALSSRRWSRLGNPAWSLIVAAIPGLVALVLVWYSVTRAPTTFSAISGLLKLLSGVFVPVYVGSAVIGTAGLLVAAIGGAISNAVGRMLRSRRDAQAWKPSHTQQPQPAPRYVPGVPMPSYGGPQDFGKSWPESTSYAPGSADPAWRATEPYAPRGADAPAYPGNRPAFADAPGPRRNSPSPAFQRGEYPADPYGPLPPLGPQNLPSAGGWPPPPQVGPPDTTWPAPGRPPMPAPRPFSPGQSDDSSWPQRDVPPPPWPPSRR